MMSMSTAERPVKGTPEGTPGVSVEYLRGLARGIEDVRANLPVSSEYRSMLDEFAFGYRSGFYLTLLKGQGEGRSGGLCTSEN